MARYRKKPIEVEATQWFKNGDHPLDYSKDHDDIVDGELDVISAAEREAKGWEGDIVRYYRVPNTGPTKYCGHCKRRFHDHGWIDTKEGGRIVCPGDWIITGVAGEHYPCKPEIFEATYEPVQRTYVATEADIKYCQQFLIEEGRAHPRTCQICGLGPCHRRAAEGF